MSAPISRTQAWCKLAALIADGLPSPRQIAIDRHGVVICLDTLVGFEAWSEQLGARRPAVPRRGAESWSYNVTTEWHGMLLVLAATVPVPAEVAPEAITEDMTRVREIAEHGQPVEQPLPDPEREETLRVEEDAAERRSVEREQRAEVEAERDEEPVLTAAQLREVARLTGAVSE